MNHRTLGVTTNATRRPMNPNPYYYMTQEGNKENRNRTSGSA